MSIKQDIELVKKNNWYFIHIPKCGGISVTKMTNFYLMTRHLTYTELERFIGDEIKTKFMFSVVRNPWDRVVSWYFFHKSQNKIKELSFEQWVKNGMKTHYPIDVFKMKKNYLNDGKDIQLIGKIEELDILKENLKQHGIPCNKEVHHNKSKRKKDYKTYYDKEMKEIVYNYCKEDIEYFKYDF